MQVEDTRRDPRFANAASDAGSFRFYAGAPLVTHDGYALGTLCVLDYVPRQLTPEQSRSLRTLALAITGLIESRRGFALLSQAEVERQGAECALQEVTEINTAS